MNFKSPSKSGLFPFVQKFESAADSSLNLVVIADFKGEAADISNRLRRSIQRWCVEAATENDWEIPFPQMQLHAENIFET